MSWNSSIEPACIGADDVDVIEALIVPRARDIGRFAARQPCLRPDANWLARFVL